LQKSKNRIIYKSKLELKANSSKILLANCKFICESTLFIRTIL